MRATSIPASLSSDMRSDGLSCFIRDSNTLTRGAFISDLVKHMVTFLSSEDAQ